MCLRGVTFTATVTALFPQSFTNPKWMEIDVRGSAGSRDKNLPILLLPGPGAAESSHSCYRSSLAGSASYLHVVGNTGHCICAPASSYKPDCSGSYCRVAFQYTSDGDPLRELLKSCVFLHTVESHCFCCICGLFWRRGQDLSHRKVWSMCYFESVIYGSLVV